MPAFLSEKGLSLVIGAGLETQQAGRWKQESQGSRSNYSESEVKLGSPALPSLFFFFRQVSLCSAQVPWNSLYRSRLDLNSELCLLLAPKCWD